PVAAGDGARDRVSPTRDAGASRTQPEGSKVSGPIGRAGHLRARARRLSMGFAVRTDWLSSLGPANSRGRERQRLRSVPDGRAGHGGRTGSGARGSLVGGLARCHEARCGAGAGDGGRAVAARRTGGGGGGRAPGVAGAGLTRTVDLALFLPSPRR